ncbi:MAG: MBOAT family protein [Lachnospiraceae bacterium]|nr:MBOAT family protein [Lachnospiraceae bacterium]
MAFTDMLFIGRFLPLFLIIYYLVPRKYKDAVLFIGSIVFYAYGDAKMCVLLLGLTVLNYWLGHELLAPRGITQEVLPTLDSGTLQTIEPPTSITKKSIPRKAIFIFAVFIDVCVLIFFKVITYHSTKYVLPLGISFYIFKMISYQADIYTNRIKIRPTFTKTAVYFTMFPQIAQGPIMRYEDGDFDRPHGRVMSFQKFEDGIVQICIGVAMKVMIADRIGILWNEVAKIGYENISTPLAWIGAFSYTFQLYFDFWGYSLIASGLGMLLGFKSIENFKHPYASKSIAEFYRRWHATLGTWFKNYIYFPLGGSRCSKGRTVLNLMIVWALTGLWHGGDINFLIWGLVLGLIIVFEKFVSKDLIAKYPFIGRLHIIILIPLTWVIFAISDLPSLGMYFARLFPFFGIGKTLVATDFLEFLPTYLPYFIASIILCFPQVYEFVYEKRRKPYIVALLLILFWISMYYAISSQGNSFMYFSF